MRPGDYSHNDVQYVKQQRDQGATEAYQRMGSSPEVWQAETEPKGRQSRPGDEAEPTAILILDARHPASKLVLANSAASQILTPAVGGAPFIGSPLSNWLAAAQARLVTESLARLSKLHPIVHRRVAWPFIWGDTPALTKFELLDWDPGQALVMLSFSAVCRSPAFKLVPSPSPASGRHFRGLSGLSGMTTPSLAPPARMRRSEDLLRAMMANTADTLAFLDTSLMVQFLNRGCEGRGVDQLVGEDFGALLPQGARSAIAGRLYRVLATGDPLECPYELVEDGGVHRFVEIRAATVLDAGVPIGICLSIRDTTELKRLEREILGASTLERQRIGRDLHDGLGQDLTGVALMLRALATQLERECPHVAGSASDIMKLVNQSLQNARALAHGLLPAGIERGGLIGALRALAGRSREMYGLDVRFRAEMWPELRLDEAHASDLYRIAQEALTNVARHAGATWAKLQLHVSEDHYCLKIADNGRGIPQSRVGSPGVGQQIMARRAEIIGAKLEILGNSPRGTLIRVTGPLASLPTGV